MWCVGEITLEYRERMEDVLATYKRPYRPMEAFRRSLYTQIRKLVESSRDRDHPPFPSMFGKAGIADITKRRSEVSAWNRRVNRSRTKIDWSFDRKKARKTFGYKAINSK